MDKVYQIEEEVDRLLLSSLVFICALSFCGLSVKIKREKGYVESVLGPTAVDRDPRSIHGEPRSVTSSGLFSKLLNVGIHDAIGNWNIYGSDQ